MSLSRMTFRVNRGKAYQLFVCEAGPEVATCQAYEYFPGVETTPYLDSEGNFVSILGTPLKARPRPIGKPFKVNNFHFDVSGGVIGSADGSRMRFRVKSSKSSKSSKSGGK